MWKMTRQFDAIAVLVVFLLAILLEYNESFSLIEDETLSYRHLFRSYLADEAETGPTQDVVIVFTDEEFYTEYGKYPLTRADLAKIIRKLKQLGAKVIGIDMLLDYNSAYGEDPELEAAIVEAGNVLLVSQASFFNEHFQFINRAIPRFSRKAQSGYSNVSSNSAVRETIVRLRIYPEIAQTEPDGWPFAVQAVSMWLDASPRLEGQMIRIGDDLSIPLDQFGDLYIDYPRLPGDGSGGTRKLHDIIGYSAMELLQLEDQEELSELKAIFKDRIVLIGEVAEVAHDEFETPVGNIFGVEIIANSIATLLRGGPLQAASLPLEALIAVGMGILMYLSTLLQNPLPRNLFGIGLIVAHVVVVSAIYVLNGLIISMSYVLIAGVVSLLAINLRFYLEERGQKALIRSAFGQYLSPKVVSDLVKDPGKLSLGGEERVMTAYFSDIARFSSFSETLSPSQLVQLLNDYLTVMCDIIIGYEGTVDKFEGDAVIAFWGAPTIHENHAQLACYASIDMKHEIARMREDWARRNRPNLNVRMGLNTGRMLVGNMGSAQRMNYTMMGDAVNLASRLEGANKAYGSDIMLSEHTYRQVADFVDVRELDTLRVVGKNEAVTVYQLLSRKDQTTGVTADLMDLFSQGRQLYKQRDFHRAMQFFEKALALQDDQPSRVYIERCRRFTEHPPKPDWDGVFTLEEKG